MDAFAAPYIPLALLDERVAPELVINLTVELAVFAVDSTWLACPRKTTSPDTVKLTTAEFFAARVIEKPELIVNDPLTFSDAVNPLAALLSPNTIELVTVALLPTGISQTALDVKIGATTPPVMAVNQFEIELGFPLLK